MEDIKKISMVSQKSDIDIRGSHSDIFGRYIVMMDINIGISISEVSYTILYCPALGCCLTYLDVCSPFARDPPSQ